MLSSCANKNNDIMTRPPIHNQQIIDCGNINMEKYNIHNFFLFDEEYLCTPGNSLRISEIITDLTSIIREQNNIINCYKQQIKKEN